MQQPEEIPFNESARYKRHEFQTKGLGSRLGRAIASRGIDRPRLGKRKRGRRIGDIDLPTGGVRGYKKPTGTNIDIDADGWVDEGTKRPRWIGIPSGKPSAAQNTSVNKPRPVVKMKTPAKIADKTRAHKLKNYKYGDESVLGGRISIQDGPNWLRGLTNQQISSLVVPDSYETHYKMWLDHYGTSSLVKGSPQEINFRNWFDNNIKSKQWKQFDYSPESRSAARKAIEAALEDSPVFSWAVRNYGAPVFGVVTLGGRDAYFGRPEYQTLIEKFAGATVNKNKKIYPKALADLELNMVSFFPNYVIDRESHDLDSPVPMNMNPLHSPSRSDATINRSLSATVIHEWSHWLHQMALRDSENIGAKNQRRYFGKDTDEGYIDAIRVATEYSDFSKDFLKLHEDKIPFEETPNVPRTITSYGHANMREALAEGMVAYMHPNEDMKHSAINQKLRKDVETLLGGKNGKGPWSKTAKESSSLSSGRRERRSSPSGMRLEKTIPGKQGRNYLSSGAEEKIEFSDLQKEIDDFLDVVSQYFNIPEKNEGPLDVRNRERTNAKIFRQSKSSGVPDESIGPDEWFSMDTMDVRRVSLDALDLNGKPTGEKIELIMHSPEMHQLEQKARAIGESVHQEVLRRLEERLTDEIVRPENVEASRNEIKAQIEIVENAKKELSDFQDQVEEKVTEALEIITNQKLSRKLGYEETLLSKNWDFSKVDTSSLAGSGQVSMMSPEVVEAITELKDFKIKRKATIEKTISHLEEMVKLGFLSEVTDDSDRKRDGRRIFIPKSDADRGVKLVDGKIVRDTPSIIVYDVEPAYQGASNFGQIYRMDEFRTFNVTEVKDIWKDIPDDSKDDLIHVLEMVKFIDSVSISSAEKRETSPKFIGSRFVVPEEPTDENILEKLYASQYRKKIKKLTEMMGSGLWNSDDAPKGARDTLDKEKENIGKLSKMREKHRKILVPYRMAYRDVLLEVMNEITGDGTVGKPDLITSTGGMGSEKLKEVARKFLPNEIIRQINSRFGNGDYPYKKRTGARYRTTKKGIYAIKKPSGGGEAHFYENNLVTGFIDPNGNRIDANFNAPIGSKIIRAGDSVMVNVDDSDGSNLHELIHVVTYANPLASLLENLFFQRRVIGGREGKREENLSQRINRGVTKPSLNKLTDSNWPGDYGNPVGTGKRGRSKRDPKQNMVVFDDQFMRTYQGRVYAEGHSSARPPKETFTVGAQNLLVPEEEIVSSPEIDLDSNNFVVGTLLLSALQARRENIDPTKEIPTRVSVLVPDPPAQVDPIPSPTLSQDVIESLNVSEVDIPVGKLSSGQKIKKPNKEQKQVITNAEKIIRDSNLNVVEIPFRDKTTGQVRTSPIFQVSGRPMILVEVNGVRIPFYRSSGSGGKKNVPIAHWYPIFGIGKEVILIDPESGEKFLSGGWFNKGPTEEDITNYYGVTEFREISQFLDSVIGPYSALTTPTDGRIGLPVGVIYNDIGATDSEAIINKYKLGGRTYEEKLKKNISDSFWDTIHRDLNPVSTPRGNLVENKEAVIEKIVSRRVKLDIDSMSPTVKRDKMSGSELKRVREVELEIKDSNGEKFEITIDSKMSPGIPTFNESGTVQYEKPRQSVTVVMTKNGIQVGLLNAETDVSGRYGHEGKLVAVEILVNNDYKRRGYGKTLWSAVNSYNIGSQKVHASKFRSDEGELFVAGVGLSSGKRPLPEIPNKVDLTPGDRRYGNVAGNGDGDCFPAANNLLETLIQNNPNRTKDFKVVHGVPLGTGGDAEGLRFHHAWVEETVRRTQKEVDEILSQMPQDASKNVRQHFASMLLDEVIVHDHSNGRQIRMPKEVYYAIGQIDEQFVQKYSRLELLDEQMKTGHHGPYGTADIEVPKSKRGAGKNRKSRRGLSSDDETQSKLGSGSDIDEANMSLASGSKYRQIVRNQPRPSDKQIEAASDFKDLMKLDEMKILDKWTVTGKDEFDDDIEELIESDYRTNLKNDIKKSIETLFSNEIELDNDIIVESRSGEKINLGRRIMVTAFAKDIQVGDISEEDVAEQEIEIGEKILDVSKATTNIQIKMSVSPVDKEAVERLIQSGVPESLIDINNPKSNIEIATAYRDIVTNGEIIFVSHKSIFVGKDARKYGIASAVNGRNESIYTEIGADFILTQASSSTGDQQGATHWARNGFSFVGEPSKQKFIRVIDDAIKNYPDMFSDEERRRISSLYKNANGKFESSATPEDLVDFASADEVFKNYDGGNGVSVYFKREVAQPNRLVTMKNRMQRRISPVPSSTSLSSGADEKPAFPRKPTYGPFIGRTNEVFGRARSWQEFKDIYENTEITYIDYETTGLVFDEFNEPSSNGFPTQIGAVKMKNGKVVARFETYVNPGIPTEQWEKWSRDTLVDYDGKPITNDFIQSKMSIAEAHRKLAEFIGPNAILGVQNAAFDKDVLEDNLTASNIDWRPDGWIDLKDVAALSLPRWSEESQDGPKRFDKKKNKFVPSNSLKDITEYLGVELGDKHHTADADAEATAKSMAKLIDGAIEKNWSTQLFDAENRLRKAQIDKNKFDSEVEAFRSAKETYQSRKLSSGIEVVPDARIREAASKTFAKASPPEKPSTPLNERLLSKITSSGMTKKDGSPITIRDIFGVLDKIAWSNEDPSKYPHPQFNDIEERAIPIESIIELFKELGLSRVDVPGSKTKKILGPIIPELVDLAGDSDWLQDARDYALPPLEVWAKAAAKSILGAQELQNDLGEPISEFRQRIFRRKVVGEYEFFVLEDANGNYIMRIDTKQATKYDSSRLENARVGEVIFDLQQKTPGVPFMAMVKRHMYPNDPQDIIQADSYVISANGNAAAGGRNIAESLDLTKITPFDSMDFANTPSGRRVEEMFRQAYTNIAHNDEFARRYAVRIRTLLSEAGLDPDSQEVKRAVTLGWASIADSTEEPAERGGRFISAALLVRNLIASLYRPSWDVGGESYTTPHEFMHLITGQGFTRHGEMASNIGWLGAFGKDVWPVVANLLGVQARFFNMQKVDEAIKNGKPGDDGNRDFKLMVLNEIQQLLGGDGNDF